MIQQLVDERICARMLIAASLLLQAIVAERCVYGDTTKFDKIVASEAKGLPINRREVLDQEQDSTSQWQSGRILIDGQWLDMEKLNRPVMASQLAEYQKIRSAGVLDVEGNRRMALWCQSHGLQELADVHWKAVVAISVDDAQARKALEHKQIGNEWFSKEELSQAAKDYQKEKSCLKDWMPKVRKVVSKLKASDAKTKIEGMKELESIHSEEAVNALKYGVMQLETTTALPLVSKIKSIRSEASCLALCEIALADPNSESGRSAIEGLKQYDQRLYVPEILQTLELPISLTQQSFYMPNGALVVRRAYLKESMSEKELTEMLKVVALFTTEGNILPSTVLPMDTEVLRKFGSMLGRGNILSYRALNEQARSSMEKLLLTNNLQEARRIELLSQIQQKREANSRFILSQLSGLPVEASSEEYWNWWPAFNEEATSYSEKPTVTNYVIDDFSYVQFPTGGFSQFSSCLIAGTPVQSSTGLKSVEQFKIGDSVVSMSVETGEISLRPVTFVSERAADATYAIRIKNGEKIRATGGHNWWVAGQGWTRSRDLHRGQFIRTGSSCVEVSEVNKIEEPIKVYNLIVDENHTYFVGKDRLLSWDVTSLQPTLQAVPGQTKRMYINAK